MDVKILKLLLVEDNPGDARLVQETLHDVASLKFDIYTVDNLSSAIETLGLEDFDIVLLDLSLPDSQGLETCMKLRGEYPDIPVIVLTGLDDEELALRALHQGAQDYLVKGKFETSLLLRSMRYGIERKKIERETLRNQKLQSLEALSEGIAHDFNNLLSSILGNLSLARVTLKPSNKIFGNLKLAEDAAFKAKDLTKQFLSLTQGGDPVKKTVEIDGLLKEFARSSLGESNIMLQFNITEGLWPVEADQAQLGQVINNIVADAKELLLKGGLINITASNITAGSEQSLALTPGSKYVKVDIHCKQLGINQEKEKGKIDPLNSNNREGSGIRLATSHSIIERHGGNLETGPDTGSGKITTIYLPASADVETQEVKKIEKVVSGKGNVLIMEDDALVRDTVIAMINRLGYDVDYAGDAEETVEKYEKSFNNGNAFDAVLIDLTVNGELQGIDAIEKLKDINPEVVAILSTGYLNSPVIKEFREYGFKELLHKPYDMNELGNALKISMKQ